jgi:hypothetical protein
MKSVEFEKAIISGAMFKCAKQHAFNLDKIIMNADKVIKIQPIDKKQ